MMHVQSRSFAHKIKPIVFFFVLSSSSRRSCLSLLFSSPEPVVSWSRGFEKQKKEVNVSQMRESFSGMVADQTRKQGLLATIFTYLKWENVGIF